MKSHNKEKHVNIDDLSQPQLIMQHFRNYDLDKNGKIDGLELLKAALIMNGKDLFRVKMRPVVFRRVLYSALVEGSGACLILRYDQIYFEGRSAMT